MVLIVKRRGLNGEKRNNLIVVLITVVLFFSFFYFGGISFTGFATVSTISESEFNEGSYNNTEFNGTYISLVFLNETEQELPGNGVLNGSMNMTGNVALFHLNENYPFSIHTN